MSIEAVPSTKVLGSTVDISPLVLRFHFWEHAYYHQSKTSSLPILKKSLDTMLVSQSTVVTLLRTKY
jgi:hypothetical protein